jgi:predicted adenylyl cyclase CyaB
MPRNLELKARIRSTPAALAAARKLGARDAGTLKQTDVYYRVPAGRLKLRSFGTGRAELIAYERPDARGGRYSQYLVLPVADPKFTRMLFRRMFGIQVTVKKVRRLFLYRNARIHLDSVQGLGSFIEFEVMVTKGPAQARRLFETLVAAFGLKRNETIAGSYSDMLVARRNRARA